MSVLFRHFTSLTILCIIVLILDVLWIQYMALPLYTSTFPHLLSFQILPALLFYVLFVLALWYFTLYKHDYHDSWVLLFDAALFGFSVYAGYAFTMAAVFAFWPFYLSFIECAWGSALASVSVFLTCRIHTYVFSRLS